MIAIFKSEDAYVTRTKQCNTKFKGKCNACGDCGHMSRACKHRKAGLRLEPKPEEKAATTDEVSERDEYEIDEYGYMCQNNDVPVEVETTVSAAVVNGIGGPTNRTLIMDSACTTDVVGN